MSNNSEGRREMESDNHSQDGLTEKQRRNLEIFKAGSKRQKKWWFIDLVIVFVVMFIAKQFIVPLFKGATDTAQPDLRFGELLNQIGNLTDNLSEDDFKVAVGYANGVLEVYFSRMPEEGRLFYEKNNPACWGDEALLKKWLQYMAAAYKKFTPDDKKKVNGLLDSLQVIVNQYAKGETPLRKSE